MRIATLQLAPKLGDIEGNISRANALLQSGKVLGGVETGPGAGIDTLKPDVLVLPELALTGYNFPSLEAIEPYLEPAGQGPSASWARETAKRYRCKVCVGYPEIEKAEAGQDGPSDQCYNSLLVVDENGEFILNYRKSFLYYTDETWAEEGDVERGFHELTFAKTGQQQQPITAKVATSFGICMDINPYRFEAPFTAWEFANRVLDSKSQLVVLSMAWLTLMSREELASLADKPDLDTFNYWIQRFLPLVRKQMAHDKDIDESDVLGPGKQIIIVFANRAGEEEGAKGTNPARYAGSSTIIAVRQQPLPLPEGDDGADDSSPFDVKILCWDMMGAGAEGICFADTTADPKMVFGLVKASG